MSEQNEIVKVDEQPAPAELAMRRVEQALVVSDFSKRFAQVLGAHEAGAYVNAVLIAVANDPRLQQCEPASILTSALTLATLKLSAEPALGQAYLVAKPVRGGGMRAEPWVSYHGLYTIAMRTGRYDWINVMRVREGQEPVFDELSGRFLRIEGSVKSDKIIGWLAAFQYRPKNGADVSVKAIYMTVEEIHEHAKTFNPTAYNNTASPWQKNAHTRQMMERKTVLRRLLREWGDLDPSEAAVVASDAETAPELAPDLGNALTVEQLAADEAKAAAAEEDALDDARPSQDQPQPEQAAHSRDEAVRQLGFDSKPDPNAKLYNYLAVEVVDHVVRLTKQTKEDAIKLLIEAKDKGKIAGQVTRVQVEGLIRELGL